LRQRARRMHARRVLSRQGGREIAALQERTNGVSANVPGGSARFFRATGVTATDRATLVWQRRASGCYQPGCYPSAMTLTNLDLQQIDPTTGALQAQSNSGIDNVEQVRSPGAAATAIYKVKAASSVDGLPAEPFAVTSKHPLTPLATPQPSVTVDVAATTQRANDTATVTATVRNPSPDLTAEDASVTLDLPAGVEITNGAQTRSLGTLATSSPTQTFTWTIKGTTDGLKNVIARAQASRYGETFTSTATDAYTVDATGPAPTIASPAATTTDRALTVAWGGTDAHSEIATYDVELSTDGGAWTAWLTGTTQTQATHTGVPGHRYRFRVRATDSLGNGSAWLESPETTVTEQLSSPPTGGGPGPTVTPPPPPAKLPTPKLSVAKLKRMRAGLAVTGRIDGTATGRVLIRFVAKVGRKSVKSSFAVAKIKRGRFATTVKLGGRLRSVKRGTLELRYGGDPHFAAHTLKRSVTTR